jgi:N-acetylglutamate synthase-like GNAT family acetyltransferase
LVKVIKVEIVTAPKIRDASPFDIPALLDMLRQYRHHTPLPFLAKADDEEHITKILSAVMAGKGVILVAETDKIDGMIIASISPSLWSPEDFLMTEMAYWVNPDARGSTAGYRLLKAYVERGNTLKSENRISAFFISKMNNSPDLKFAKFGFTKLEEFWVI